MEIKNPIIGADMPDPDLLRVGDVYYMVSTTMFYMPGAPILRSKDLYHWEIVSYVFETIEDNEIYRLENGKNAYGKGQWATSLAAYRDRFYACFVCHDMGKTFIYSTDDIEKNGWEKTEINRVFHDMSFLFWKGKPYLVYGNGTIGITELKEDLSGLEENGLDQTLLITPSDMRLRCEGCRALVKDGWLYLLFIEWPKDGCRREVCYRANSLEGPFERKVLMEDDGGLPGRGVAQGTLVESAAGEWYAVLFQDRGASGRIPYLMQARWEDGWPVLGENGRLPEHLALPFEPYPAQPVVSSDSFCHDENRLMKVWQWNHNPDDACWSFTSHPGWLSLEAKDASGLLTARNTLTQRTMEPGCRCEVILSVSEMREGDYAGLCALQGRYGQIGVKICDGKRYVLAVQKTRDGGLVKTAEPLEEDTIQLRIDFDYRNQIDLATFYFRTKETEWKQVGEALEMVFTLDLFVGYRIGIFHYHEKMGEEKVVPECTDRKQEPGQKGRAAFRNFTIRPL